MAKLRVPRWEFERIVARAVEGLPEPVKDILDNVDILVEDWPTEKRLAEDGIRSPYGLLGLYEGVPHTGRGHYDMTLPDRITLFRNPILSLCATRDDVEAQVRMTLLHEIAHHLGWDDGEMHRMGLE
jgi:predicted Zn-dependent protease with MMP-like domain